MEMNKIDERTEKVLKKYAPQGYDLNEAVWPLKRKSKEGNKFIAAWVAKHKALEVIAAHNNIKFDMPQIIEADANSKIAVVCVSGSLGDKTEWSFGESTSYNTQNDYPFAMAEKRAKDRVILKLLGLHGDLYSEEEAYEFKETKQEKNPNAKHPNSLMADNTIATDTANLIIEEMERAGSSEEVDAVSKKFAKSFAQLKPQDQTRIKEYAVYLRNTFADKGDMA